MTIADTSHGHPPRPLYDPEYLLPESVVTLLSGAVRPQLGVQHLSPRGQDKGNRSHTPVHLNPARCLVMVQVAALVPHLAPPEAVVSRALATHAAAMIVLDSARPMGRGELGARLQACRTAYKQVRA